MVPVISLLVILTLSILITRIGTVGLTLTGLSREVARFQARSAFMGVGFTTSESEKVVNHPVRRRILLILMLLGNAGIVTAISSLILTFINVGSSDGFAVRSILLGTGLLTLWVVGVSPAVDRHLSKLIGWALKRYTHLELQDYVDLLNLTGEYRVTQQQVKVESWMANKTLKDLKLRDEGIMVLGITRENGTYLGAPTGTTKIFPKDTLILYGRSSALENLDRRLKGTRGDREHDAARFQQKHVSEQERQDDPGEKAKPGA